MNDNGYVYVLINPSIRGMVKIGKTTRTPEVRAEELSASTGVPTPFIVVYSAYFEDCTEAEKFVHTYLENEGVRVSTKREFFEMEIKDAIGSILKAVDFFTNSKKQKNLNSQISCEPSEEISKDKEIWEDTYIKAMNYHSGNDDELIDYVEALKYYLLSIQLGAITSFSMIGLIYEFGGYGVKKDLKKSLNYYKEGAKKGHISCWTDLARLYEEKNELDNAKKAWKKYFKNCSGEDIELDYCYNYIVFSFNNSYELKHIKVLSLKKELIELMIIKKLEETDSILEKIIYEDELEYINNNLMNSSSTNEFLEKYIEIIPLFIRLNYHVLLEDFLDNNINRLKKYIFQFLENIYHDYNTIKTQTAS